ncbi:MAG TPA: ABC transporter permease, partial [Terriglobia bacterium]|nr:ABC transporter permease [Terriglobia bacterium]
MQSLPQDLRYGFRMLVRNPGVTVVMVLTLGLAIGANTAIFSVVYGVLLRSLPYPKPDQILSISEVASDGHLMNFADPNVADLRAANHTLSGMAKVNSDEATVSGGSGPARVGVAVVSRDFFSVMGVAPIVGRGFAPDELKEGGTPAVLVSYGYWREHLDASSDLAQFKLKMDQYSFSVVGVLPAGFDYPAHSELWVPAELFGDQSPSRTSHNWSFAVARLRDGVTLQQARAELSTLARHLHDQYKPNIDMTDVSVMPLQTALTASVRPALLVLLGAVAFLLLVGCVNVANLLLARAAARGRELAVRAALGAGRGRLVRQFLAESLLLSLGGGTLGVLAAIWGVDALLNMAPGGLPRLNDVSVSLPVLLFALGVSVLVAAGLGVLTALRASSVDPQQALTEGGWAQMGSVRSQRLGRTLVAIQLATTLVLLAGAGLLGRSLMRVLSIDPGFRTAQIATMELEVPASPGSSSFSFDYKTDARPGQFASALFDRLRAVPGVEEVGGASVLPLGAPFVPDGKFLLLDRQPDFDLSKPADFKRLEDLWTHGPGGEADYSVASDGYFRALGIPLLRGRLFDERDTAQASQVAVISQSLARATWPGQDPIGRTIEFGNMDGDMRLLTIVGVVGDVRDR